MPFTLLIGDWIYILVWGMVLGVLYIRTGNPMLTGLIGVLVFSGFLGTSSYLGSSTSEAFYWGFVILSAAVGMVVFYLLWTRSRQP